MEDDTNIKQQTTDKMCVQKTKIRNRKYSMNKKNGGNVPVLRDERQLYIDVPCGQCYICRKKKAREWMIRMSEDLKKNKNAKIVTLTFNTESLKELAKECDGEGYELDNRICKLAVKRFRENWRRKYGKSPRHWLVTELGHGKTEHIHMHGIIWEDNRYELKDTLMNEIVKLWRYGWVCRGKLDYQTGKFINYVNSTTAKYFTKYVTKIDEEHKEYRQIILTSPGIGANFLSSKKAEDNIYQGKKTNQTYNIDHGTVAAMPEYYRRKMYTDDEREKLTSIALDKNTMYIDGKEIRKDMDEADIYRLNKHLREKNARLGYGDGRKNHDRIRAENSRRRKIQKKRGYLKS